MRNYDLEFLKHFSMVIGFLMLVTAGLIVGAYFLHDSLPPEVNPKAAQITEALMTLKEGSHAAAEALKEFKAASQHMAHSVEGLTGTISRFRVE